jgi:predicted nuclease of predicted toxin-antitoxin system
VKFLVDNQLPAALARFLTSRGADCQHVLDVGLADATDSKIWEHATIASSLARTKIFFTS